MGWRWRRGVRSQEYLADAVADLARRCREADALARERHRLLRARPVDTGRTATASKSTTGSPATAASKSARHDTAAFHLPDTIQPVPGLVEEVARLSEAGRPRQALDVVMRVLRDDPRSADAHRCALMLCSARKARSNAADPITEEQLRDPLLDPVRTVCTSCGTTWFSAHELVRDGSSLTVVNPVGLQCQTCRYTVCRTCLTPDLRCPGLDCAGELGTPVLATGLPAAPRFAAIEQVVVVIEQGEPEPKELFDVFSANNPDVDLLNVRIHAVTAFPGVDDTFGYFVVMRLEREGRVRPGALQRTALAVLRHPAFGVVRFYLVEAG
ncbi:hypothetical protein JNUCC0626_29330 [Lentzea sp. JNUCC 0626]|uniref:hypothetical protein n=1 Tax=Lentzea sp. JNUCC 0626 TaxID=3367513 RepID=UPI003747AB7E